MSERSSGEPNEATAEGLRRIGSRQLGLVTVAQLHAIGFDHNWRAWAVRKGWLERVRRTVYALPGSRPSWHRSALAAVLAAGPEAVASHETAGIIWGLLERADPNAEVHSLHLTCPRQRRLEGVVVHCREIPAGERAIKATIPVTTVARTLFDLAGVLTADRLGRCTDEALRRSIVDVRQINQLVALHGGPGRRRLQPLMDVLGARLPGFDPGANDWEKRMDELWDQLGLPFAERQYVIGAGRRHYRVDRAIPALRFAVEWVGIEYHAQVGAFRQDRRRISDLALAGWDVLEIPPGWDPDRVKRTVLAKVAERQVLLSHESTESIGPA